MDRHDINLAACHQYRKAVKLVADEINFFRKTSACVSNSEAIANIILAYRHLEDASMRLGKAIQALDGGVSVYDKTTTVGA